MLAAGADALLRVRRALQLGERMARVDLPDEDGLELVHARVDEEQRRVLSVAPETENTMIETVLWLKRQNGKQEMKKNKRSAKNGKTVKRRNG